MARSKRERSKFAPIPPPQIIQGRKNLAEEAKLGDPSRVCHTQQQIFAFNILIWLVDQLLCVLVLRGCSLDWLLKKKCHTSWLLLHRGEDLIVFISDAIDRKAWDHRPNGNPVGRQRFTYHPDWQSLEQNWNLIVANISPFYQLLLYSFP